MTDRRDTWLYLLQRGTAIVLAPLVLGHLVLILIAVRGGLDSAEILGRTRGSLGLGLFYGLFVVAAAIHGAIGMRNVLGELLGWQGRWLDLLVMAGGCLMLALGFRAVGAVL